MSMGAHATIYSLIPRVLESIKVFSMNLARINSTLGGVTVSIKGLRLMIGYFSLILL